MANKTVFSKTIDFLDVASASSMPLPKNFIVMVFPFYRTLLSCQLRNLLKSILHCKVQLFHTHLLTEVMYLALKVIKG